MQFILNINCFPADTICGIRTQKISLLWPATRLYDRYKQIKIQCIKPNTDFHTNLKLSTTLKWYTEPIHLFLIGRKHYFTIGYLFNRK